MDSQRDRSGQSQHSLLKRGLNDRIFEILTELGGGKQADFVCECSDETCIKMIPLPLREYAALQTQPDRPLLTLPEHPD